MKTWFISDTHFGHSNILNFKTSEGKSLRPFLSVEEMDDTMIKNWNRVVSPDDKVYHLGDVVMHKKHLQILDQLNGRKTLIAGNHDIFNSKEYTRYFDNIRAYKIYPEQGIIFSHIPVHPAQLERRFKYNFHGHLHSNHIMLNPNKKDERYFNICVEQTNYTPILFDEILNLIKWENPHNV
jgi:calcineurin-like phosphoesterase family protein